mgnify:CR=1 FL=1
MELYKKVNPITINTINRLNKLKKWEYGYNKEHDIVVISTSKLRIYISLKKTGGK